MNIPIVWYGYNGEYRVWWDMAMLESLFGREMWLPVCGHDFVHYEGFQSLPEGQDGAIVVIPARHQVSNIGQINADITGLRWVLVILVGDEEASFPTESLTHPNMMIYQMTPHPGKHTNIDRHIPNGWAPDTRPLLRDCPEESKRRELDWFFSGQVTHKRRRQAVKEMGGMKNGKLVETEGFTQGLPHDEYYRYLASAKVAPCPSGAVVPDSFRLYEALEAGCYPIVDQYAPQIKLRGYWDFLFGEEHPLKALENWRDLPGTTQYFVDTFPVGQNKVFAWWQGYKREMAYNLEEDLHRLRETTPEHGNLLDKITVLVVTSPVKDNPDTSRIQETIESIRERLPHSEIMILFDGVRKEQGKYTKRYNEYIRRVLWKTNFEWMNVLPIVFEEHYHQASMTREALKLVKTPTILFVEHDAPLIGEVPFEGIADAVISGEANVVRLHHEAGIHPEHTHLMLDTVPVMVKGVPMLRTAQWSQRPHVASTTFYRDMIDKHFSPDSRTMIEDRIYGIVVDPFLSRGKAGWNDTKLWMYAPEGDMKRSTHTDGRMGDPKYEMVY